MRERELGCGERVAGADLQRLGRLGGLGGKKQAGAHQNGESGGARQKEMQSLSVVTHMAVALQSFRFIPRFFGQ
ncbi:hypothetical protein [Thioalkalivibrio sp. ALM2T]|uniref:hypothetical protein n=1 Tax=Thioalkalivibrio sp. ALM2T TaxID=1158184 RepID=UPI001E55013D|nr:hypothetical protein [Thioalkalivibrio sp. ALM2T]